MKKKINYTDEPKDGLELPDTGFEVLTSSVASQKWPALSVTQDGYIKIQKGQKIQLTPKRGGTRAGAGRKSTGHVRLHLAISPATRKKIESIAKLKNITLSEAVEQLAAAV
ncbi:MAG: hypothetical protein EBY32_14240 [Proteobacteria bacterium]|nr:hypothetical protein [Pseudomonadota bacterium]